MLLQNTPLFGNFLLQLFEAIIIIMMMMMIIIIIIIIIIINNNNNNNNNSNNSSSDNNNNNNNMILINIQFSINGYIFHQLTNICVKKIKLLN